MKFKTGEEAIFFFIENKNSFKIENQMVLKIIEDEGHGLRFQSNSNSNNPEWTSIIETIVDIERILRRDMVDSDVKSLMRFAIYGRTDDIPRGQPIFDAQYEVLGIRGKQKRVQIALQRFEAALFKDHYLSRP